MKAEDVWRLHDATKPLHARYWDELSVYEQAERIRFARACEQHGVERAVSALQATVADSYTDHLARLTRERVESDLKKENDE